MKTIILFLAMLFPALIHAVPGLTTIGNITQAKAQKNADGILTIQFVPVNATGLTITAAWPKSVSSTAYTQTSATATTINVTFAAGTSGPCIVCLGSTSGTGTAFLWFKDQSDTAPSNWDGITEPTWGNDIAVDAGVQCIAAGIGDRIHTISPSTGDVVITRQIDIVTGQ